MYKSGCAPSPSPPSPSPYWPGASEACGDGEFGFGGMVTAATGADETCPALITAFTGALGMSDAACCSMSLGALSQTLGALGISWTPDDSAATVADVCASTCASASVYKSGCVPSPPGLINQPPAASPSPPLPPSPRPPQNPPQSPSPPPALPPPPPPPSHMLQLTDAYVVLTEPMVVAGTSLVIKGVPGGTTLDAQGAFRHLKIHEGAKVTLIDVELVNGFVSFDKGGCILVHGEGSELRMQSGRFYNCHADGFLTGAGGGLAALAGGTFVLEDVVFDHCTGDVGGGGIWAEASQTSAVSFVARGVTGTNLTAGVGGGFMAVMEGGLPVDVAIHDSHFEDCTVPAPEDSGVGAAMGGVLFVFAASLFSRIGGGGASTSAQEIGPLNVTLHGNSFVRCTGGMYGGAVCLYPTPRPYHQIEVFDCSFIECQQAMIASSMAVRMHNTVFEGSWSDNEFASALHLRTLIPGVQSEITNSRFQNSWAATPSLITEFQARGAWPSSMLIRDTEFTNLHQTTMTDGSGAVAVYGAGAESHGGVVTIETSTFTNCTTSAAEGGGGAVGVTNGGNLTIRGTAFSECHALKASGGALFVASEGVASMSASSISSCSSMRDGGAVSVRGVGSAVVVRDSVAQDSTAVEGKGGLISASTGGAATVIGSTLQRGIAAGGGCASAASGGSVAIVDSASSDCTQRGATASVADGGCFYASGFGSELNVVGSSVDRCHSPFYGGAFWVSRNARVLFSNSTSHNVSSGDSAVGLGATFVYAELGGVAKLYNSVVSGAAEQSGEVQDLIHARAGATLEMFNLTVREWHGTSTVVAVPETGVTVRSSLLTLVPSCATASMVGTQFDGLVWLVGESPEFRDLRVDLSRMDACPDLKQSVRAFARPDFTSSYFIGSGMPGFSGPTCASARCGTAATCADAPLVQGDASYGTTATCVCNAPAFPMPGALSPSVAPYVDGCGLPRVGERMSVDPGVASSDSVIFKIAKPLSSSRTLRLTMTGAATTGASWSVDRATVPSWLHVSAESGELGADTDTAPIFAMRAESTGVPESPAPYEAAVEVHVESQQDAVFVIPVVLQIEARVQYSQWGAVAAAVSGDALSRAPCGAAGSSSTPLASTVAVLGEEALFPFTACDADALPVAHALPTTSDPRSFAVTVRRKADGSIHAARLLAQPNNGVYDVSFTASLLGDYELTVSLDGAPPMANLTVSTECPRGQYPTPDGLHCGCPRRFRSVGDDCVMCPTGYTTEVGDAECLRCDEGFYAAAVGNESRTSGVECHPCPEGATCPWDATLRTMLMQDNYWRLTAESDEVEKCDTKSGVNGSTTGPCTGGGAAACAAGHGGPLCQVCVEDMHHIDAETGLCVDCPDSSVSAIQAVAMVAAAIVLLYLFYLFITRPPSCLKRASDNVKLLLHAIHRVGPGKAKAAVTYYQIILSLPVSFSLDPLDVEFYSVLSGFRWLEFEWDELLYPTGCLMGGFFDRLMMVALAPLALIVGVPILAGVLMALFKWLCKTSPEERDSEGPDASTSPSRRSFNRALSGRLSGRFSIDDVSMLTVGKWQRRALSVLPLALLVTFVSLPAVSRVIFSSWDCVAFKSGPDSEVRYLRRDMSIVCGTPEHDRITALAWVLVAAWPIGIQGTLWYMLWTNRKALLAGENNVYTRALKLLTGSYKPHLFWWEAVELFRRLTCSGFIILIAEKYIFARVVVAVVVSVAVLAMTAYLRPSSSREDLLLSIFGQVVLVLAFGACFVIRITNSADLPSEVKNYLLGFVSPKGVFIILGLFFVLFAFCLLGSYAYRIIHMLQVYGRRTGDAYATSNAVCMVSFASFFSMITLVGGTVTYGALAGFVAGCAGFFGGAAVGASLYQSCGCLRKAFTSMVPEEEVSATDVALLKAQLEEKAAELREKDDELEELKCVMEGKREIKCVMDHASVHPWVQESMDAGAGTNCDANGIMIKIEKPKKKASFDGNPPSEDKDTEGAESAC